MKILHLENLAGVPAILAKAQIESGHQAKVLETRRNPYNFPHDIELYYGGNGVLHDLKTMKKVSRSCIDFDLVHVHGGINRKRFDVLGMHCLHRKPIIVHYHGSETRMGYGMAYRSIASAKIVSRPDLLDWHTDATFIPNPIESVPECSFDIDALPKVVHVSNNPVLKGTAMIKEAMTELAGEGLAFRFDLVENLPHKEVLDSIAHSNVLIDQVLPGNKELPSIIGMVSLEAMVRGKAVVSTFDQKFRPFYPECPVVAIDYGKAALKDAVRQLVSDMDRTRKLGVQGRKYVSDHHSPRVICDRVMAVYEGALE
jgi:hypothetical protein